MKKLVCLTVVIIVTFSSVLSQTNPGAEWLISPTSAELNVIEEIGGSLPTNWLLTPTSAELNGMGGIGVCLPTKDPNASYFNPANGIEGYKGISITYSNLRRNWGFSSTHMSHSSIGLGLIPESYPFQIVVKRQNTILDAGEWEIRSKPMLEGSTYLFKKQYISHSFTLKYSGNLRSIPFNISSGISRKKAIQKLIPEEKDKKRKKTENIFYDIGLLASTPLKINIDGHWDFNLSPALGYSFSNIGDFPKNSELISGPQPRISRIGLSLFTKLNFNDLSLIKFKYGISESKLLKETRDNYSGISSGTELSFIDIFSIRYGRRIDESVSTDHANIVEYGFGINSSGIINLLYYFTKDDVFSTINQYINIRYDYSEWNEDAEHYLNNTKFSSFTLYFTNIGKLMK